MHDVGGVAFTWMHTCCNDDVLFILKYWQFLIILKFLRIDRYWCTLLGFKSFDLASDGDARHLNTTKASAEVLFLHDTGDTLDFLQTSDVGLHPTEGIRITICEVNLVVGFFEIVLKL